MKLKRVFSSAVLFLVKKFFSDNYCIPHQSLKLRETIHEKQVEQKFENKNSTKSRESNGKL